MGIDEGIAFAPFNQRPPAELGFEKGPSKGSGHALLVVADYKSFTGIDMLSLISSAC
jgi:hypothetical protein